MNPWLVMVLGMCTVFFGLICLILLTKLMGAVVGGMKKKDKASAAAPASTAVVQQNAAPVIADRGAFDAAVAAAIAAYIGKDISGLRICSLKQISK